MLHDVCICISNEKTVWGWEQTMMEDRSKVLPTCWVTINIFYESFYLTLVISRNHWTKQLIFLLSFLNLFHHFVNQMWFLKRITMIWKMNICSNSRKSLSNHLFKRIFSTVQIKLKTSLKTFITSLWKTQISHIFSSSVCSSVCCVR